MGQIKVGDVLTFEDRGNTIQRTVADIFIVYHLKENKAEFGLEFENGQIYTKIKPDEMQKIFKRRDSNENNKRI